MRLFSSAPPVNLEIGLLRTVRRLVYRFGVSAQEGLERAAELVDVVDEVKLRLYVREDAAEDAVRGRMGEEGEERSVEEGLQERQNLRSIFVISTQKIRRKKWGGNGDAPRRGAAARPCVLFRRRRAEEHRARPVLCAPGGEARSLRSTHQSTD